MKKTSLIPTLLLRYPCPLVLAAAARLSLTGTTALLLTLSYRLQYMKRVTEYRLRKSAQALWECSTSLTIPFQEQKRTAKFQNQQNAGSGKVTVDTSTYNLLKSCTELSRLTDGAFDITLGDISDMWGFGTENPPMPDSDELKNSQESIVIATSNLMMRILLSASPTAASRSISVRRQRATLWICLTRI